MNARRISIPALLTTAALALVGCSASTGSDSSEIEASDAALVVVASTSVYADIAAAIAGDDASVSAVITSGAQDPHSYEASARDRLTVSKADLVVRNGGGYDAFIDGMIPDDAAVLTAIDFASDAPSGEHSDEEHAGETHGVVAPTEDPHAGHDHAEGEHTEGEHTEGEHTEETAAAEPSESDDHGHTHIAGFNEHVWYDPEIMLDLAGHIAEELSALDPDNADAYATRLTAFDDEVSPLIAGLDAISADHGGEQVFATEPVGLRLLERAGLVDATPAAFGEAVEEGQDVPAATLLEALDILASGTVKLVVVNTQTGGAETDRVETEAEASGLPVVALSELLPEGETYATWMGGVIDEITQALA